MDPQTADIGVVCGMLLTAVSFVGIIAHVVELLEHLSERLKP